MVVILSVGGCWIGFRAFIAHIISKPDAPRIEVKNIKNPWSLTEYLHTTVGSSSIVRDY